LQNTIVIFTSDHGEMHMEHRQYLKNSMGTRSSFQSGKIVRDHASLVDIYPTLADASGVSVPSDLAGSSLLPYLDGTSQPGADRHIVAMYMSNMANTNAFMIRKGPWKYIAYGQYGPDWYKTYNAQLFNMEQDPFELHDVSAANAETCKALDTLLRGVVDYEAVDQEVKMEERMLYDRYYKDQPQADLQKEWQKSYMGFDDGDMKKVKLWYQTTGSAPQPELSTVIVV